VSPEWGMMAIEVLVSVGLPAAEQIRSIQEERQRIFESLPS